MNYTGSISDITNLKYSHFLITRFNLKQKRWATDKNNGAIDINSSKWLERRFRLFRRFTFPSVESQTCKKFVWLVYFDSDTPNIFREEINNFKSRFINFTPCFIDSIESLNTSVTADIQKLCYKGNGSVIITTRLDNDDGIHEGFIAEIQKTAEKKMLKKGIIDIPNGYCLDVEPLFNLFSSTQFSNAFISYVEPYNSQNELKTVLFKQHQEWAFTTRTILIRDKRLWIQIIHVSNVLNKIDGVCISDTKVLENFHFQEIAQTNGLLMKSRVSVLVCHYFYITKKMLKYCLLQMRRLKLPLADMAILK